MIELSLTGAVSLSSVHITNSVSHYDSGTQAYLSHLLLDPEPDNSLKRQWIIRIRWNLDFSENLTGGRGVGGEKIFEVKKRIGEN